MSTNRNSEPVATQHNEFHPRVPRSEPMTTKGHKPGVMVGKDAVPEFHAETHRAGTAPSENTFRPQPKSAQDTTTVTDAASTLTGATSQDLNQGMGKPIEGMTSQEMHGFKRKKERSGLEGINGSAGVNFIRRKGADLPEGVHKGVKASEGYIGAEERIPETAETVAAENSGHKGRV